MAHGLLDGLRVIEYARELGAAYCGKLLAGAGADVIAVEPPDGSEIRRLPPFVDDEPGDERGLAYLYTGVNKRSITLDLQQAEGRARFLHLLSRADALVEDCAPGQLQRLGIDDAAVSAARPGLVWASLTAFGQTGPYQSLASSSLVLQALSGWLSFSGEPDREPVQVGGRLAELAPGLLATVATLGALLDGDMEGGPAPRHVDVSSFEAMVNLHPPYELASSYLGGRPIRRNGNRLRSAHPFTIVPCDGGRDYIGVIHLTETQWEMICHMMDIDDLLEETELQTNAGRVANADRIDAAMAPWLMARTAEECFHAAQNWRIPFALVPDLAGISSLPQHVARGYFKELSHAEAGVYRTPELALHPTGVADRAGRAAPALGADNASVFAGLDGSANERSKNAAGTRG